MIFPGKNDRKAPPADFVAAEDAGYLADEAGGLIDAALGVGWYTEHGGLADRAALTLCRLRRARAGELGSPEHGDEAVRRVLGQASPEALVWIASRAISYMDEYGFPEAVEPWFGPYQGPV